MGLSQQDLLKSVRLRGVGQSGSWSYAQLSVEGEIVSSRGAWRGVVRKVIGAQLH